MKKETPAVTRAVTRRGRPAGAKNKPKAAAMRTSKPMLDVKHVMKSVLDVNELHTMIAHAVGATVTKYLLDRPITG